MGTPFRYLLALCALLTPLAGAPIAMASGGGNGPNKGDVALAIHVKGNQLIDGSGKVVQLRGASASGLESIAIAGWSPANPWGGPEPDWAAMRSWKLNVVRLPLNEASWLGLTTYDAATGKKRVADPGGNYQATVIKTVNDAVAAGLYVDLDLHWAAPNVIVPGQSSPVPASPLGQNPMADADHSIAFWTSIAQTFKGNPAVMFELFNEPFFYWLTSGENQWAVLRDGGTITQFITGSTPYTITYSWKTAGMQSMLNAIRATGATNVVLAAGTGWATDIKQWVAYKPNDSIGQLAAVWHAYRTYGTTWGTKAYAAVESSGGDATLAAGFPVIVSETGDRNAAGTVGAPLVSNVLSWADKTGASVLGWGWNAWQDPDNILIKDREGTPSDGYGRIFHDWAVNHP